MCLNHSIIFTCSRTTHTYDTKSSRKNISTLINNKQQIKLLHIPRPNLLNKFSPNTIHTTTSICNTMKFFSAIEFLSSFLVLMFFYPFCHSLDNTITINHPIRDGDVLVSNGLGNFALGSFSPRNSTNRYVGIWYDKISEQTSCGLPTETLLYTTLPVFSKSSKTETSYSTTTTPETLTPFAPPTFLSVESTNNVSAKLLDTGNLVLVQTEDNKVLWQSFDYYASVNETGS